MTSTNPPPTKSVVGGGVTTQRASPLSGLLLIYLDPFVNAGQCANIGGSIEDKTDFTYVCSARVNTHIKWNGIFKGRTRPVTSIKWKRRGRVLLYPALKVQTKGTPCIQRQVLFFFWASGWHILSLFLGLHEPFFVCLCFGTYIRQQHSVRGNWHLTSIPGRRPTENGHYRDTGDIGCSTCTYRTNGREWSLEHAAPP